MNKLSDLLMKESLKTIDMDPTDGLEYLCNGSIISFCNVKENKERHELHGSLPAKLYILIGCVETLAKEEDINISDILDFLENMSGKLDEDEPFKGLL